VLLAVPNACWLARVAAAPLPKAAEFEKFALLPVPTATALAPVT
jgi:hypothetical protein